MQDLISRQAALREYQSVCYGINCDACPFLTEDEDKLCKLALWIHGLPSAQPERKKGKWIDGTATHIKTGEERAVRQCSQCGAGYFRYDISENTDPAIPNFCPNCGSDNRGEKDEAN